MRLDKEEVGMDDQPLDLFKDFTSEEIKLISSRRYRSEEHCEAIRKGLKSYLSGLTEEEMDYRMRSSCNSVGANGKKSETQRLRIANLTEEEKEKRLLESFHNPEAWERAALSLKAFWSSLSQEEKNERLKDGIHSEEARKKVAETVRTRSLESYLEISNNMSRIQKDYISSLSEREREERLRNSFHSEEARRKAGPNISESQRRFWAALTEEEKRGRLRNSFNSDEAFRRQREHLACLTPEEMMDRMRISCLSDEAILKSALSNHASPSMPEWFVGYWLGLSCPEDWAYTGDRKSMGLLRNKGYTGLKCPDFININGRKAVIEVLGGLGWWHTEEEVDEKVSYYGRHGFSCLVLLEEDCYDYGRLEAKFKAFREVDK